MPDTRQWDRGAMTNARILIREVKEALRRGTRHYAADGRPLLSVEDVLDALTRDGRIELEPHGTRAATP